MMQTFLNTANNQQWSFNTDVVVTNTAGVYSFRTAAGVALAVPTTLQPNVPAAVVPVVAGNPTKITPLAFLARFTAPEQTAIATAALATPAVFLWLSKASAASYIDLTDPQTAAGLAALVAAGLLTAPRETVILTP